MATLERARELLALEVPFLICGRTLGGLDCFGFARECIGVEMADRAGYLGSDDNFSWSVAALSSVAEPSDLSDGSIVVFRRELHLEKPFAVHFGVVSGDGFIHCSDVAGHVIFTPWNCYWRESVQSVWRVHPIARR